VDATNTRAAGGRVASLPVERRDASTLSYAAFQREYIATNRPVVIENAVTKWPALKKWTPDYFKATFGPRRVDVSYEEKMTFSDFIDGVVASSEAKPGPYMYRFFIGPHLPDVLPDVLPQNDYAFPRRLASPLMPRTWKRPDGYLKLLIGGVGGRFPIMHYDTENMHAAITEIYGDKAFVLFPPEDTAYLYPRDDLPNKTAIKDIDDVDLAKFPLFAKATRYETLLRPGDMVFVPSKWWHTARVVTTSISICQNMLDGSNWSGFVEEISTPAFGVPAWKRHAKRIYLTMLGWALALVERLPRARPSSGAVGTSPIGRLAPLAPVDAIDARTWPMSTWSVE
jgi:hypothetical protein